MPSGHTKIRQRMALRISSRERMLQAGLRRMAKEGLAARRAVIAAFQAAHHVIDMQAVADVAGRMAPILRDLAAAAHLKARYDMLTEAAAARPKALSTLDSATAFLKKRMKLTSKQIDDIEETYGPYSAKVASEYGVMVNRRLASEMAESIAANETVKLGIERLEKTFDELGLGQQPSHALESVFRTQTQLAYSAGEWNTAQDPDIQDILWGYEYVTVGDERVRPEHAALEGVRLKKDDPRWNSIMPPNGFNCRCATIPIYDGDGDLQTENPPVTKKIDGQVVSGKPDDGWAFNPGRVFADTLNATTKAAGHPVYLEEEDRWITVGGGGGKKKGSGSSKKSTGGGDSSPAAGESKPTGDAKPADAKPSESKPSLPKADYSPSKPHRDQMASIAAWRDRIKSHDPWTVTAEDWVTDSERCSKIRKEQGVWTRNGASLDDLAEQDTQAGRFTNMINHAPAFKGEVYRGMFTPVSKPFPKEWYEVGNVMTFDAAASASKHEGVAQDFAQASFLDKGKHRVMLHLKLKNGADLHEGYVKDHHAMFEKEGEVVVRPLSRHKIVRVEKGATEHHLTKIYLEEL